jgi:hypothetical protein
MDQNTPGIDWTPEQWHRVTSAVNEEVQRARVAACFLPTTGPVENRTVAVAPLTVGGQASPAPALPPGRLVVNSDPTLFFTSISSLVYLRAHEASDPDLTAALVQFRRTANIIGRIEDGYMFLGRPGPNLPPPGLPGAAPILPFVNITGAGLMQGLLPFGIAPVPPGVTSMAGAPPRVVQPIGALSGPNLVNALVAAITALEGNGFYGPFACALSNNLFQTACAPAASFVAPRDSMLPFLDAGLHRSSAMIPGHGVVVALGGRPLEIVRASDIKVKLLQLNTEPRYVFRVSERVALRTGQLGAVAVLHL